MNMQRFLRGPLIWVTLLLVLAVAVILGFGGGDEDGDLTYGEFLEHLQEGDVTSATILSRSNRIEGELEDGTEYTATFDDWVSADDLSEALTQAEISPEELDVDAESSNMFVNLLLNIVPFLLILGLFVFLMSQMGGGRGLMSFGRSRAKMVSGDNPSVTFEDVAGVDEALEELKEIRDFLANPTKFQAIGARIPKGVLLFGPPGTGKTLLARAVAGEAGVPFFTISGSDFVEMFVGVGASRVRDLFEKAKVQAPAIIFVDEIDAVGRHRGAGMGGGHDEREQTLNQLLVEMDGFDENTGVILIAATNRPDILDPALLRPGRFDRQIAVDRPDLEGRKAILAVHSRGKPLAPGVDLAVLAKRTPGFTGADLSNLINEAALLSARRGLAEITMETLEAAIDRVIGGPERRTRRMDDEEKRLIAYHEGGHTIVGHALPHADPIHKVSIISRGKALGWTLSLPTKDKYLVSRGELVDRLSMMLGGRVAEMLTIGDYTTGASDDISKATATAREMVTQYGMSSDLGPVKYGEKEAEPFMGREAAAPSYSGDVAKRIDDEIRRLIDEAHNEALEILVTNREVLEELADQLIEHETVEKDGLAAILAKVTPRPSRKIQPLMNGAVPPDRSTVVAALRRGETTSQTPGGDDAVPSNGATEREASPVSPRSSSANVELPPPPRGDLA